jgi:hypothetical protein
VGVRGDPSICHNLPMCGRYRLSRRKQLIEEHFDSVSHGAAGPYAVPPGRFSLVRAIAGTCASDGLGEDFVGFSAEPGFRRESTSAKYFLSCSNCSCRRCSERAGGSIARTLIASSASMRRPSRLSRNGLLVGREVFGVANHGLVLKFTISERILCVPGEYLRGHARA